MARIIHTTTILGAALCLALSINMGNAQMTCSEAEALADVNATALLGQWYEVARNPAKPEVNCVAVDLSLDNDTLTVSTTFANNPNAWNTNQTAHANVSLTETVANNNTVQLIYNTNALPQSMLKLLETDYKNYVLACGYTNASDPATSYGMVLARSRMVSNDTMQPWLVNAVQNYTNFVKDMPMVVQSDVCYKNGATSLAATSAMLTLLFSLLKMLN